MPNYVTQMSKDSGGAYLVKDTGARGQISDEVTARESAIAAETAARESAIADETAARESAIADETAARESAIAAEAAARESAIAAEAAARESAIAAEASTREAEISILSADIDQINNDIGILFPIVNATRGTYVTNTGSIAENNGYKRSSPIAVKAYDELHFDNAHATSGAVGVIAECDSSGNVVKVLVVSDSSANNSYRCNIKKDCYVMLSYNQGWEPTFTVYSKISNAQLYDTASEGKTIADNIMRMFRDSSYYPIAIPMTSQKNSIADSLFPIAIINKIGAITKIISHSRSLYPFYSIGNITHVSLKWLFTNNTLILNGTKSGQSDTKISITPLTLPAGTYTFSVNKKSGTLSAGEFYIGLYSDSTELASLRINNTNGKIAGSFTIESSTTIDKLQFADWYNQTFTNICLEIMLEAGNTATEYVDYVIQMYDEPNEGDIIYIGSGGTVELTSSTDSYDFELLGYQIETSPEDLPTLEITVGSSGKNYTSLVEALKSIPEGRKAIVYIYPGTYTISNEWTADELSNANYPNGFYGTVVPKNCSIVGVGDRNNIIIYGESNDTYTWQDCWRHISVLNMLGNNTIQNVTVKGKSLRYTIHDDFASEAYTEQNYIGCVVEYYGTNDTSAIGCGSHNGETLNIVDCDIRPQVGWHGHNPAVESSTINIKDSVIRGRLVLEDYAGGVSMPVNIINTKMNYLNYSKASALASQYMIINIKGFSFPIVTDVENVKYDIDGIEYAMAYANISKGQPVKIGTNMNSIAPMSSSDSLDKFIGFAMENIPYSQYNQTDYVYGAYIKSGYVSSLVLGLAGLSVGDKIGIENGVATVVTENAVGVVDYVVNDIAYIRLL